MTMRCPYCEYEYVIMPPLSILAVLGDPELPQEDYMLWMERFIKSIGIKEYQGMLIHEGIKHKGEPKGYNLLFTEEERKLIEHDPPGANATRPAH